MRRCLILLSIATTGLGTGVVASSGSAATPCVPGLPTTIGGCPTTPPPPPTSTSPSTTPTTTSPSRSDPQRGGGLQIPASAPVPHTNRTVGIADGTIQLFDSPYFNALSVGTVRINVPWDFRATRDIRIDTYMRLAHKRHIEVVAVFVPAPPWRPPPSIAAYKTGVRRFMRTYPWIRIYGPWNEMNLSNWLVHNRPRFAAQMHMATQDLCPGCTILGGEYVLGPPTNRLVDPKIYTKQFLRWIPKKRWPKIWALHPYTDANRFQRTWLKAALHTIPAHTQVWLDEVGGMVHRPKPGPWPKGYEYTGGVRRANEVTRYIFTSMVKLSSRIRRVYVYQWTGNSDDWDSGLLDGGTMLPRPAYFTFKKYAARPL